jgi:HEAT repeat protein
MTKMSGLQAVTLWAAALVSPTCQPNDSDGLHKESINRDTLTAQPKDAVPALIEALKDGESWVREEAAQALRSIGSPAVPALCGALKDEDVEVRYLAAKALGDIGDKSAISPIKERLRGEQVSSVQYALTEAIKTLEGN